MNEQELIKCYQQTQYLYAILEEGYIEESEGVAFYDAAQKLLFIMVVKRTKDYSMSCLFFEKLSDFISYKYACQATKDAQISCLGVKYSFGDEPNISPLVKWIDIYDSFSTPQFVKYDLNGKTSYQVSEEDMQRLASYLEYFPDDKSGQALAKTIEKTNSFHFKEKPQIASMKWSLKTHRFITAKVTPCPMPDYLEKNYPCFLPQDTYPNTEEILAILDEVDVWSRDCYQEYQPKRELTEIEISQLASVFTKECVNEIVSNPNFDEFKVALLNADNQEQEEQIIFELRNAIVEHLRKEYATTLTQEVILHCAQELTMIVHERLVASTYQLYLESKGIASEVEDGLSSEQLWYNDPYPMRQAHRLPTEAEQKKIKQLLTENLVRAIYLHPLVKRCNEKIRDEDNDFVRGQMLFELRDIMLMLLKNYLAGEIDDELICGIAQEFSEETYLNMVDLRDAIVSVEEFVPEDDDESITQVPYIDYSNWEKHQELLGQKTNQEFESYSDNVIKFPEK